MSDLFAFQSIDDPELDNLELDENVIQAIPEAKYASRIYTAGHGASFWARTACVNVEFPRREIRKYFLKVASGDRGRGMMEGQFESSKVIHAAVPEFAAEPIAWGTFKSNPDLHFFLCTFHEMDGEIPKISTFTKCLANMHRNAISPNGKYGFHVTTYNGNLPQDVRWTDTWEECFVNGTKQDFKLEEEARGENKELKELQVQLFAKVIPRLLRPLESGGRKVHPSFIHGDLWFGNASNDLSTGHAMVFDAAGLYGHNEFDVKSMRIPRYQFGRNYINSYNTHIPVSEPEEDLEARLALYSLRSYLHESALFPSDPQRRQELIVETRKLVEMFPSGLKGYDSGEGRSVERSNI